MLPSYSFLKKYTVFLGSGINYFKSRNTNARNLEQIKWCQQEHSFDECVCSTMYISTSSQSLNDELFLENHTCKTHIFTKGYNKHVRGVFRTLSNIKMNIFSNIVNGFQSITIFGKSLSQVYEDVPNTPLRHLFQLNLTYFFSVLITLILYFCNKKVLELFLNLLL